MELYISENTADWYGQQAVRNGKAKYYHIKFVQQRDRDTHEVLSGYKLYLFN